MINTNKPTDSLDNTTKVSYQETWNSNITTWNTETRTWNETGSLLTNTTRQSSNITNTAKI